MKIRKNILISIGALSVTVAPIAATISCGTSWKKWTPDEGQEVPVQDPNQTNIQTVKVGGVVKNELPQAEYKDIIPNSSQYATGDITNIQSSLVTTTDGFEIKLDNLTNQFQVNMLLIKALNLKPVIGSIEDMWKSDKWDALRDYINQITNRTNITFSYKGKTTDKINWDFVDAKIKITSGLDPMLGHLVDFETNANYINATTGEIAGEGLSKVATAGSSMLKIDLVSALLKVDANYALNKLALLTNLSKTSFDGIQDMLKQLGTLAQNVWQVDDSGKFNQLVINDWAKGNTVIPGIMVSDIKKEALKPNGIIDGALLLQALSDKYKEVK